MQQKHPQDLKALTLDMDETPESREAALAFLRGAKIALPNYTFDLSDPAWEKTREEAVAVPYLRIYDKQGKLAFGGFADHEELEMKVAELLKQ